MTAYLNYVFDISIRDLCLTFCMAAAVMLATGIRQLFSYSDLFK